MKRTTSISVEMLLDISQMRLWHAWIIEDLSAEPDLNLSIRHIAEPAIERPLQILLDLETTLIAGPHAMDQVSKDKVKQLAHAHNSPQSSQPDITLDLRQAPSFAPHSIAPLFNGSIGLNSAIESLLNKDVPYISLRHGKMETAIGTPSCLDPHLLSRALDCVLSRLVQALIGHVQSSRANEKNTPTTVSPHSCANKHSISWLKGVGCLSRFAIARIQTRLKTLTQGEKKWGVAYRATKPANALQNGGAFDLSQYSILPDDGLRFFADPFTVRHSKESHLFVEEFPYSTRKGIISYMPLGPDATPEVTTGKTPIPILELDVHLSYPYIFEHDGVMWMIPETMGARNVQLYRASSFPDKWELETILLDNIEACDVTLHFDGTLWWMFASERYRLSSACDGLSIYYASNLHGPWTPHPKNPVIVDAGSARPGGNIFSKNNTLWRAAQHCVSGYGDALTLCEITTLSKTDYAQSVQSILTPEPFLGFHTLSYDQHIEAIDLYGYPDHFKTS